MTAVPLERQFLLPHEASGGVDAGEQLRTVSVGNEEPSQEGYKHSSKEKDVDMENEFSDSHSQLWVELDRASKPTDPRVSNGGSQEEYFASGKPQMPTKRLYYGSVNADHIQRGLQEDSVTATGEIDAEQLWEFPLRPSRNRSGVSQPFNLADGAASDGAAAQAGHGGRPPPLESANRPLASHDDYLSDFSPWTGDHPEDRLSEQAIKSGYQVKAQILNEANTAKASIWPHLKNKAGLQNLSALFTSVLEQRRESGRVTAPSTFKPPPRVTLTDTKREVWLRDLANPSVPLRRLSRTIPHGIRGKVLLEQCLAKTIPVARALWLAKCVGANELRAFRRKGISGAVMLENEQKWVKEWTSLVENFIEDSIGMVAQDKWKENIVYTLQLSSRFYAEGLLDNEHFSSWALGRLESCSTEQVPISLLVVQLFRKEITSGFRNGHRLTNACFKKLSEIFSSHDKDILMPLVVRLRELLYTLAIEHPWCVIIPDAWPKTRHLAVSIKEILEPNASGDNERLQNGHPNAMRALRAMIRRNDGISSTVQRPKLDATKASLIIRILDAEKPQLSTEQLSAKCLKATTEPREQIAVLVQWACSLFRYGNHRIYTAARLIRYWAGQGVDTNDCILRCMDELRSKVGISFQLLSRLVAELIRSGNFDTARFLRALIANGGLHSSEALNKRKSYDMRILLDMPLNNAPPNITNLRNMLLRSSGKTSSEKMDIWSAKRALSQRLPEICASENYSGQDSEVPLAERSVAVKFEISDWLQQSILSFVSSSPSDAEKSSQSTSNASSLSIDLMKQILGQFIETDDFVALGNFLLDHVTTDSIVLGFTASIVEVYFETFAAIGIIDRLTTILCEQYRVLRARMPPQKEFAQSILNIAAQLPSKGHIVRYAKRELAIIESNVGVAANTPMSDLQIESIGEIDDDLERLLAGGSSLDSQSILRALETVVSKIVKSRAANRNLPTVTATLGALKASNEKGFDLAMFDWLQAQCKSFDPKEITAVIPTLLASGCITPSGFLDNMDKIYLQCESNDEATRACVALAVLQSTSLTQDGPMLGGFQDFGVEEMKLALLWKDQPQTIFRFVLRLMEIDEQFASRAAAQNILHSASFTSSLRRIMVENNKLVVSELESSCADPKSNANLKRLIAFLIDECCDLVSTVPSEVDRITTMFDTVDGFALPFYSIYVRLVTEECNQSEPNQPRTETYVDAAVNAELQGRHHWVNLVASVSPWWSQQIRHHVEKTLLSGVSDADMLQRTLQSVSRPQLSVLASIVEITAPSIPEGGEPEKGHEIERNLVVAANFVAAISKPRHDPFQQWLSILLRIAVLHSQSCTSASVQTKVLYSLCSLLARNSAAVSTDVTDYIFDVAIKFASDLTPRAISQMRVNLGSLLHDTRLRFLFDGGNLVDPHFHLTSVQSGSSTSKDTKHHHAQSSVPFPLRTWELFPESTPNVGDNDTALNLRLFDAKKLGPMSST